MPLSVLCDEHIPYEVIAGLVRQGIDAISVQQAGLRSASDPVILAAAREQGHIVYTGDYDYLILNASGFPHLGIFYHRPRKYSIGEAIAIVALACQALSMEEMQNRVEYL